MTTPAIKIIYGEICIGFVKNESQGFSRKAGICQRVQITA